MKPSRYNFFIDMVGGGKLAFNSASAYLAEVYQDKYPIIQRLLSGSLTPNTDEEKEFYQALTEGQYLVDDTLDEISSLKAKNRTTRFDNKSFLLTIAPTLACNFKCDYCFESQRPEMMKDNTIKSLLKFGEKYIRRAENMVITWFGGEPTLCVPIIERISGEFQSLAAKFGAAMQPATIISNGYILDGAMAEKLKLLGIHGGQITLDGPERVHDIRRKLHSGKGTFQRIIHNLIETSPILKWVIRVNVDRDNHESAFEVVEVLDKEGILANVYVYFAQVNSSEGVCGDMLGRCLSTEEFSINQVRLYQELINRGYYQIEYPSLAPGGHCGADTDSSFVVTPDGMLYKCWEELTLKDDRSIGSVFSDELTPLQRSNRLKYLAWDPFEKAVCRECNILPMCMAGCPSDGLRLNHPDKGACIPWKYNLEEMLTLRYICDIQKQSKSLEDQPTKP